MPRKTKPANQAKPKRVRKRTVAPSRVAIIGAGQGGTALMEIFAKDPLVKIVGIAEIRPKTSGVLLARQLKIPVTRDYRDLLKMKNVDLVIDVTGNPQVERALLNVHDPHLAVVGGGSAKFMWQLIEARIRATAEIEATLTRYQSLFQLYVKEEAEGAVNDERTRIACDIHDGLVQTLVGVNLKMERCRELVPQNPVKALAMLNQTTTQLKNAIQEARQVIYNLRPGRYDNLELVSALSNFLKSYKAQHRIRTVFTHGVDESLLAPKTKVFLFRMVQEALHNVAKHAKATHVNVGIAMTNGTLKAHVTDDGIGFDLQAESNNPEKWDHFGLRGMMERARMLMGDVEWISKKGKGTCVTIQVPIGAKEKLNDGQKN